MAVRASSPARLATACAAVALLVGGTPTPAAAMAVAVGPRIVGSGDLQLDAPGESLALLEAMCIELENGGDATRIDAILRGRAHA